MDKKRKCKLSRMSDEEIEACMMSVDEQLNDAGFDSGDDISGPDFQPDDFIEESTDRAILECLDEMEEANTSSAFGGNRYQFERISKFCWKKKSLQLHVNDIAFRGNTSLPAFINNLETPFQFFKYFFSSEIVDLIVMETNRSAHQENVNTSFSATEADIHKFVGILLYMSLYRYPNMESYWSKNAFEPIRKAMSCRQFENIKRYLSFADKEQRAERGTAGYDPLYRVRRIAELFNERFDSVPKTARLCVDEQMCATKTKHHLRQYMPNKPHKWGIKLFVLCDTSGYAYRFEVFIGAGDNTVLPGEPDLGPTVNVVVRLSQSIPEFQNHILYFDNFYTSLPLLVYLRAKGIFSLGTIRSNRIPNSKLPSEKDEEYSVSSRGYSVEYVGAAYGVDISTVTWKDNRAVRLASTYVGVMPFLKTNPTAVSTKLPRYDRKKNRVSK